METVHDYELITKPNIGKRIIAAIIDYTLIFGYFYFIVEQFGEPNEEGGNSVNGLPALSITLFWFILTVGMEQFIGATIGNKLIGLRPAPKLDPRKNLTWKQSLKRHMLDLVEFQFIGLITILVLKNTQYNHRLGDLWAKTVVLDVSDETQGLKI